MRFIIRFVVRDDVFSSKAIKVIEIRRPVLESFLNHEKPVPPEGFQKLIWISISIGL